MVTLSRRRLFTLGIPTLAVAAVGALTPGVIARHARGAVRPPEQINFFQIARTSIGVRPKLMIRALQTYVDDYLFPVWGVRAQLSWSNKPQAGVWNVAFVDSDQNDDPDALAYHEFDPANNGGLPYAIVDVEASLGNDGTTGIAVSHELAEMLVDPGTNNWAGVGGFDPTGGPNSEPANTKLFALEVCDPVERAYFKIDGVPVSDFVFPAYFEPWRDNSAVDYLGAITNPLQIAEGGYQIVRDHDDISELTNFPQERRCNRFRRIWRRFAR